MLASITPLRERSRGFSWQPTATAFAIGAGAPACAAVAAIGWLLPARQVRHSESLLALHRKLGRMERSVRRATPLVELLLAALVVLWMA